jgi:glyoxylase-like metal-dependent hydrolase (beta-lactamase superfamily II)
MKTIFGLLIATAGLVYAQNQNAEVHVWPVQGNIYMIVGAGGNITVQTGKDGVLVVDTGLAPMADKVLAAIKSISNGPIRYIINTHYHPDHTGGNAKIRLAGSTIVGANVTGDIQDAGVGAAVLSHINVLNRMSAPSGTQAPSPEAGWPTSTFLGDQKKLYFNGEGVDILHQPAAHSDGDSIVFFRRDDVIATGDIFTTTNYPIIDLAAGGTIDALQKIVDMIIPIYGQEGGTMVVPGHGRLCDFGDVLNFREMTIIIRDRIQSMIKKGMTLEQVKAARPTQDYDPLFGSTTGFWTTDKFVEAVYKSLKGEK